jgi:hypothetical protein
MHRTRSDGDWLASSGKLQTRVGVPVDGWQQPIPDRGFVTILQLAAFSQAGRGMECEELAGHRSVI